MLDFGLGTVNTFGKMLNLLEVIWNEYVQISKTEDALDTNTKQTSLPDFLK